MLSIVCIDELSQLRLRENIGIKREKTYSESFQIVQRHLVAEEMYESILKHASMTIPVEHSRSELISESMSR